MAVVDERFRRPTESPAFQVTSVVADPVALDVRLRDVARAGVMGLCLDVAPGERVVLAGRDGATGTALLRAVAGLRPVHGGGLTVAGRGDRTPPTARGAAGPAHGFPGPPSRLDHRRPRPACRPAADTRRRRHWSPTCGAWAG
ncbi:hypothetical protein [Streptomyces antibioticus]|uniref:hypothetical protein n=1 Tax=Streptomyces antibioticus TaxID=1890 RepID=UPI0033C49A69